MPCSFLSWGDFARLLVCILLFQLNMTNSNSAWCLPSTILLLTGGVNWGLVGLGMLLNKDLNVIHMLLGGVPTLEAIVYLLVGIMAVKVLAFMAMGKKYCA